MSTTRRILQALCLGAIATVGAAELDPKSDDLRYVQAEDGSYVLADTSSGLVVEPAAPRASGSVDRLVAYLDRLGSSTAVTGAETASFLTDASVSTFGSAFGDIAPSIEGFYLRVGESGQRDGAVLGGLERLASMLVAVYGMDPSPASQVLDEGYQLAADLAAVQTRLEAEIAAIDDVNRLLRYDAVLSAQHGALVAAGLRQAGYAATAGSAAVRARMAELVER